MSVTRIKKQKSVREQVSAEEWAKRIDLAAAYRLVHLYGMDEMIANHISTRVPGEDNAFLINPYGLLYDQMHASCFIKLDLDGKILFNPTEYDINKAGFIIHSANHGLLVVGASIPQAFDNIFRLERACQLQVTTLACNTEISLPPRKIIEDASHLYQPGVRRKLGLLEWPALIRKLDAIDPSYRE